VNGTISPGEHAVVTQEGPRGAAALRDFDPAYVSSGSFASKAAEAIRPCTSAALPKADVNSPPWLPPLCATTGLMHCNKIRETDYLRRVLERKWRQIFGLLQTEGGCLLAESGRNRANYQPAFRVSAGVELVVDKGGG
jgi:hypothetical protein